MRPRLLTYLSTVLVALAGAAVVFALAPADVSFLSSSRADAESDQTRGTTTWMGEGDPAPHFELRTMAGDVFSLEDNEGRVVVLNFWATWCAPCRVEIPDLIEMQSDFGDEAVRFVGISVDHQGEEVVRPFMEEMAFNYPVVIDDGTVSEQYGGIFALPMTFVIDRDGTIRWRKAGIVTREALAPLLNELTGL